MSYYLDDLVQKEITEFCKGRWLALHCLNRKGKLVFRRYLEDKPIAVNDVHELNQLLKSMGEKGLKVRTVYATINTQRVDFTQSGTKWVATYKLPGDGSYTLYVKMVDTSGSSTILASFSIELGREQRTPLLIATLAALTIAIIWFSTDRPLGGTP